ncbi:MAG: dockerin type I domain-containing protein [Lacipirellulaceae bacterium]
MRIAAPILGLACVLELAAPAQSAVTSSTQHSAAFTAFNGVLSSSDIIHGLNAEPISFGDPGVFENPGDLGWHPANTDPANQLIAFTDGLGGVQTLTGLLNDNFPGGGGPAGGAPVKVVEYVLPAASSIGRINILTGNRNNSDGRVFASVVVRYSTNGGSTFADLGYFQSDPSGAINRQSSPVSPFDPPQSTTFLGIFNDTNTTLLAGVTNIEFSFFSVSNTQGRLQDPYDGVNSFTGVDDGFAPAFESPLVWEIDVLASSASLGGDYNRDGRVNAADYTVWADALGAAVTPGAGADGNGNGVIDQSDYLVWAGSYGASSAASSLAVPEPMAPAIVFTALAAFGRRRAVRSNELDFQRSTP